jgi:hypothetical protein
MTAGNFFRPAFSAPAAAGAASIARHIEAGRTVRASEPPAMNSRRVKPGKHDLHIMLLLADGILLAFYSF